VKNNESFEVSRILGGFAVITDLVCGFIENEEREIETSR